MWCLNGLNSMGTSKCGAAIRWMPVAREVKGFTQGRTKEIEVYGIHHRGASQDSREEAVCQEAEGGGRFQGGKVRRYGDIQNFPFWVSVPSCKSPAGQLEPMDISG